MGNYKRFFTENFGLMIKVAATAAVVLRDLHYASTQPGIMDTVNGAIAGLVILAIWRHSGKRS